MILGNRLCGVAYAVASFIFFRRRIPYEERTLRSHFGTEYDEYAAASYIGIPFLLAGLPSVSSDTDTEGLCTTTKKSE